MRSAITEYQEVTKNGQQTTEVLVYFFDKRPNEYEWKLASSSYAGTGRYPNLTEANKEISNWISHLPVSI